MRDRSLFSHELEVARLVYIIALVAPPEYYAHLVGVSEGPDGLRRNYSVLVGQDLSRYAPEVGQGLPGVEVRVRDTRMGLRPVQVNEDSTITVRFNL